MIQQYRIIWESKEQDHVSSIFAVSRQSLILSLFGDYKRKLVSNW